MQGFFSQRRSFEIFSAEKGDHLLRKGGHLLTFLPARTLTFLPCVLLCVLRTMYVISSLRENVTSSPCIGQFVNALLEGLL